jgi:signal transduction histidine kinase
MDINIISKDEKTMAVAWKDYNTDFASLITHEIKNPLNCILLSLEMFLAGVLKDDAEVYLSIIKRSSLRINDLVNELIKYKAAGELNSTYAVHQLLDEILESLQDTITHKKISIERDYDSGDDHLVFNKKQMTIAFTNIIVNAVEAMDGDDCVLTITTKSSDKEYLIQIADNGCGISTENLRYLFKPYYTNNRDGCGLGLVIATHILNSNHFKFNIQSAEGKGTNFMVSQNRA